MDGQKNIKFRAFFHEGRDISWTAKSVLAVQEGTLLHALCATGPQI